MSGTILIADATPTTRIRLKVRLAAACHDTIMAGDVATALDSARQWQPDLIVADESLAGGGVVALCHALGRDPATRAIPVIALCSDAGRLDAVRAGAAAVLARPAEEFMLLARIRSLIASRPAEVDADAMPGLAEAPAAFVAQPGGQVTLIAPDVPTAIGWRQALVGAGLAARIGTPEQVLTDASSGTRIADLYVIAADLSQPDEGLRLLAELRARPHSRHSAFVIALAEHRAMLAPVALDLGAGDVLPLSLGDRTVAEEAALRINAQLARKRVSDRQRQAAERERRWAMIDPLTGLHNRRFAAPRLQAMMAEAQEVAVMVLDLDRFKAINDGFGHAAGDAVLTEVAARLKASVPPEALLARIGGEEFLIAIPDLDYEAASRTAEALRRAIAAEPVPLPPAAGGGAIPVTASVGVAHGRPHGSAEAMLNDADRAMLRAKTRGRNRVIRYDAAA